MARATTIKRKVRVYSLSQGGRYIGVITRTIYKSVTGKQYIKYNGKFYPIRYRTPNAVKTRTQDNRFGENVPYTVQVWE